MWRRAPRAAASVIWMARTTWWRRQSRLPLAVVQPPANGNSWLGLTDQVLPIAAAYEWCVLPVCGAVVLFSGTVRDHAVDEHGVTRDDVQYLTYEAYDEPVVPAFAAIGIARSSNSPPSQVLAPNVAGLTPNCFS